MFSGVELFQEDFDLHLDGIINPGGETATKLNEVLDHKNRISKTSAQRTGIPNSSPTKEGPSGDLSDRSTKPHQETKGDEQIAVAPALLVIVYEIHQA